MPRELVSAYRAQEAAEDAIAHLSRKTDVESVGARAIVLALMFVGLTIEEAVKKLR